MGCLLLRLAGPLQSWGYRSRFSDRDTGLEPTKSGVVGLLCCALGRDRSESPADLAALKLHARVDRQGSLLSDFHTAGGGMFRGSTDYFAPKSSGGRGSNPVVTERHYLMDASFLVALEGDEGLLARLEAAVADPAWPLALGRRSCPPSEPVLVGRRDMDGLAALRNEPILLRGRMDKSDDTEVRLAIECGPNDPGAEPRRDVPVAWADTVARKYTVRHVRTEWIRKPQEAAAA